MESMVIKMKKIIKHGSEILHFIITAALCVLAAVYLNPDLEYMFILNIIIAIFAAFAFYRFIFKGIYKDSLVKIICTLAAAIAANHLYTYQRLVTVFPQIKDINQNMLFLYLFIIFLIIFAVCGLFIYIQEQKDCETESEEKAGKSGQRQINSQLNGYVNSIARSLTAIFFGSLVSLLEFVEFIPTFFLALSHMILSDETDEPDDADEKVQDEDKED
jgi:hypothetical protein